MPHATYYPCTRCQDVLIILVYEVTLPVKHVLEKGNYQKTTTPKHPSFLGSVALTFKMRRSSFCPTQGAADSLGASFFHATGGGGALWFCDTQRMGS